MQILSSLSGLQFSAASAGYAPTNSGDVSAIASAYQVVSATATQLYAGTAYVTSVNSAPISAARAGNAATASLANSAWYDGTGRLISALPDSATVSAIASSYAESAASSKLDESATADFYSTSNPSGFITGVDLSDYQPTSAMTAYQVSGDYAYESSLSSKLDTSASSSFYGSDNPSGFITGGDLSNYATTSYVDSSVSSKQDTLTFGYAGSNISSIDGSALAGGSDTFPVYIKTGDSAIAEILTGFTNNDIRKASLWVSGTPTAASWANITVSNKRNAISYKSAVLDGNALEFLSASSSADQGSTAGTVWAGGITSNTIQINNAGFSASAFRLHKDVVSGSSWGIKKSGVSGSGWVYGTAEYTQLTSVYDTVSSNSASWTGGGGGGGSYSAGNMINISSDVISFSSQAGITDIVYTSELPETPVAGTLYLIRETI